MSDIPVARRSRKGVLSSPCKLVYSARDDLENILDGLINDLARCVAEHDRVLAEFKFLRDGLEESIEATRGEVAVFDDALRALGVKV